MVNNGFIQSTAFNLSENLERLLDNQVFLEQRLYAVKTNDRLVDLFGDYQVKAIEYMLEEEI